MTPPLAGRSGEDEKRRVRRVGGVGGDEGVRKEGGALAWWRMVSAALSLDEIQPAMARRLRWRGERRRRNAWELEELGRMTNRQSTGCNRPTARGAWLPYYSIGCVCSPIDQN